VWIARYGDLQRDYKLSADDAMHLMIAHTSVVAEL
jgi:hypothetical protein